MITKKNIGNYERFLKQGARPPKKKSIPHPIDGMNGTSV